MKDRPLSEQVVHVLEQFRDHSDDLTIEDPANPKGNDLSGPVNDVKPFLQAYGYQSSVSIDDRDWVAVFGPLENAESKASKVAALTAVAIHSKPASFPWANGK